jgi:hypothetical protein
MKLSSVAGWGADYPFGAQVRAVLRSARLMPDVTCITQASDYNKVGSPMCKWHARIGEESFLAGESEGSHFKRGTARSRIKQVFTRFPNRESWRDASKKKRTE